MEDERPRDVRDSLSELEQRLLELERELRSDSARDAGAARQRIPVPRPPSGASGAIAVGRAAAGTMARERPGTDPGEQTGVRGTVGDAAALGASGGRPADAPAGGGSREPRPGAGGWSPSGHGPPPPDVGPLVDDTRRKVDALRDSLDGLTGASDRLREVAQVVVEDHGRALVRLERATAQQARFAAPPEGQPDEPLVAPAPERGDDTAATTRVAAATAPQRTAAADGEPEHTLAPDDEPEQSATTAPRDFSGAARDPERPGWRGWRRLWGPLAVLAVAGAVAAVLVVADRDEPARTTPTVPGAMSRIALTPELGPDTRAFESVPGTRPASDAGAINDLCDGVVGAAVVVRPSGADAIPPCRGLVTVASGTVSALALAERSTGGERPCVDAADVPSIAAARPNRRLTTDRAAAVQRATARTERANRSSTLTPGERAGRVHTAAFEAGRAFDVRNRLRLLAVRPEPGATCVVPGRDDVASGRYPLASRIELLAMQDSLDQLAVDRAAVAIGHLTSGPAPISATVLRPER